MTRRVLDSVIVLLAASLLLIAATGGVEFELGPLRVRLHDWTRPFGLLVVALASRAGIAIRAPGVTVASMSTYIATCGLIALLIAIGGVYAQHHIRVAGGLDSFGYVSASNLLVTGRLREAQPIASVLPFDNPLSAAAPLGHVPSADGRTSAPRFPLGLPIVMGIFTIFGSAGPFFVPLVMAHASILLAYRLARESAPANDHVSGLFAATLVAADPLFAAYAIQPMSDVPATCWLLAALWAALHSGHRGRPLLWSVTAGICAGMAILTRPALLPAVIVLVIATADRKDVPPLVALGATVVGCVALLLALNMTLYGNIVASGYGPPSHLFDLSLTRLGANASNFGKWLTYSHSPAFWLLWPGALFILRHKQRAWQMSAVAGAAAAPYLFYLVFDDWESSRFLLPSIVLVLILFGRAFSGAVGSTGALGALGALAIALTCAAASHRFLEREGIYRLRTLEAKYALVGEWFKANTSDRIVVLAGLHSGTIRLYGERSTIRWDQIPEQGLNATLRGLIAAGYEPYLALDLPSEPQLFEERFKTQSVTVEQVARVRVVNIYRFVSAY